VNSTSATSISISGSGTVNLNNAGPLDPGDCSAGTGADFANVSTQTPYPGTLLLGTKPGVYLAKASPIADPLLSVAEPSVQPAQAAAPVQYTTVATWTAHNCPVSCTVYSPGYYDGTTRRLDNISGYAILRPGIYWINHNGFQLGSGTLVRMASAEVDNSDPTGLTTWKSQVMLYNKPQSPVNSAKDIISLTANSGKLPSNETYPSADCPTGGNCLNGSPTSSAYKGILFFQSRTTATTLAHGLQGGSGYSVKGTIYLTHTAASTAVDGKFHSLNVQGGPCASTLLRGEIIVDTLSIGGSGCIKMNLDSTPTVPVRQVALVR
jgi:hypothetical protein